jgi:L-threonylcarbamoyladenylate synthase
LLFSHKINHPQIVHQEVLSANADLKEAASNLYAALHVLDKQKVDIIIAERLPDIGLGKSINDRLERATKQ